MSTLSLSEQDFFKVNKMGRIRECPVLNKVTQAFVIPEGNLQSTFSKPVETITRDITLLCHRGDEK